MIYSKQHLGAKIYIMNMQTTIVYSNKNKQNLEEKFMMTLAQAIFYIALLILLGMLLLPVFSELAECRKKKKGNTEQLEKELIKLLARYRDQILEEHRAKIYDDIKKELCNIKDEVKELEDAKGEEEQK